MRKLRGAVYDYCQTMNVQVERVCHLILHLYQMNNLKEDDGIRMIINASLQSPF
jgi:hypothetical protein